MTSSEYINKTLAERVMNWKRGADPKYPHPSNGESYWENEIGRGGKMPVEKWNPTSDLNQAFQVVEKLRRQTGFFTLQAITPDSQWDASFEYGKVYVADTPAEAICRAAIQLVQEGK